MRQITHIIPVSDQSIDHLAHWQHHAAQGDQRLAEVKGFAGKGPVCPTLQEELVFHLLKTVIKGLDCVEVGVNDEVEEPMSERAYTLHQQGRVVLPPSEHRDYVEGVVKSQGDQRGLILDRRNPQGPQLPLVKDSRINGEEQALTLASDLGTLVGAQDVVDHRRRQIQEVNQLVQSSPIRPQQVNPHQFMSAKIGAQLITGQIRVNHLATRPGSAIGYAVDQAHGLIVPPIEPMTREEDSVDRRRQLGERLRNGLS